MDISIFSIYTRRVKFGRTFSPVKRKPGNPLAKYSRKKELTEIEQLEYENMILRIENERLKKGYTQEDVILAKEKLLEKNMK